MATQVTQERSLGACWMPLDQAHPAVVALDRYARIGTRNVSLLTVDEDLMLADGHDVTLLDTDDAAGIVHTRESMPCRCDKARCLVR